MTKTKIIIFFLLCSTVFADNPYRAFLNFNAGELDFLDARENLAKYQSGCSILENMIPLPQGAAQKRPGTKYIAEVKTSSLATRILPFEFSTSQSYVIEAGNQYKRFFTSGAAVLDGVGTEDISSLDAIVAHWLLNEQNGTNVADDDGGTHDMTASVDTSLLNATGKVGTGSFDLDAQYDSELADAAAFSFDDSGTNPFSIAAWGFVTSQDNVQNILSKWITGNASSEWRFSLSADKKLRLHLADTTGTLDATLVAHWFLNDDAASTAVDDNIAVVPHDGIASSNTDTFNATGKINGALDFGAVEFATVADNAALSFGDGSTDSAMSISAWIFVTNTANSQRILTKWETDGDAEWSLQLDSSERMLFNLYDKSAAGFVSERTTAGLTAGWRHVAVSYAGYSGTGDPEDFITLYVDGVDVAQETAQSVNYTAMEDTTTAVLIGSYFISGTESQIFADKLDNVILFSTVLSVADIASLYNSGDGTETFSAAEISSISDDAIEDGWHFFTCTYDSTGGATAADGIILYVDGVAVNSTATNSASYTAMQDGAQEIRIGSQRNLGDTANENHWADKIDEISIFSDVLTPTEVASLHSTAPYEIETPYLTADLFDLKHEQSADVLYITHPDYETRKLSRLANALWTITVIGIKDGPFRTENSDVADFITASATTGSVTLTATGHTPFVTGSTVGHEPSGSATTSKSQTGALFRLVHPLSPLEFSETLTNNYPTSTVENTSWMSLGTLYKDAGWSLTTLGVWTGTLEIQRNYTIGAAHGASGWESVFDFASADDRNALTSGTEDDGDADYRAILTASGDAGETCKVYFTTDQTEVVGIVEITSVTSSTEAIGTVVKTLGSTDATYKWSEGSWSNYRGWPQTVTFFEDRLMFGGNTAQPDTIWGSVTRLYDDFTAGADDDDAVIFTLSSRQVNVIEWLIGKDKLLIGTSGAEWTIAGGTDEPLTPSNVIAKQHSTYGSANLQANLANESVLFFQRGAAKMRELAYNWELDSYVAPDMTILANEVTNSGIVDTAFQKIPNSILWTTRTDGELPVFSYERAENVTAWSRMITADSTGDSDFESVVVINGDPEDEVWVVVERTIDSNIVRYIEQFQPRDFGSDPCDAFYVDSGVTYDSTASSAMTGGSHLIGETVSVLADGVVFDDAVVTGAGGITLKLGGTTTTASTVQWGLPYTVQLRTMPLSWVAQGVTIQGKTKRISEVVTNWHKSGDFSIGKDASTLETYSITGQTTFQDRKTFPPGYDYNGYVFVYQKSPEPLTLLAIMVEFNVQ